MTQLEILFFHNNVSVNTQRENLYFYFKVSVGTETAVGTEKTSHRGEEEW